MENLIELRSVLLNANKLPWEKSIFLAKDKKWSLNSLCYLFNLDDSEEIPSFAIENNLDYVLSIADIQDIVENASQQKTHCSEMDIFNAFLFYYENDAFITFAR